MGVFEYPHGGGYALHMPSKRKNSALLFLASINTINAASAMLAFHIEKGSL
jgi:hypothetical protein